MGSHRSVAAFSLATAAAVVCIVGTAAAKDHKSHDSGVPFQHRLADHSEALRLCDQSLEIARRSSCPSPMWSQMLTPVLADTNMIYVNVGANKGYNINSFLMQYHRNWNVTNAQWRSLVANRDCGVCHGCSEPGVVRTLKPETKVKAVAVEMLSDNAAQLQRIFEAFQVPGTILHAAGGESVGEAFEPRLEPPSIWNMWNLRARDWTGQEAHGVVADADKGVRITQVTVDHVMNTNRLQKIDILSIDTEGHDDAVIRGADVALSAQKIRVLEFEYHATGLWAERSIHNTIDYLKSRKYTCFWAGAQGELSPFLDGCNYDFKRWSNVVCSHDPQVLRVFHLLVPESFRRLLYTTHI